jgi:hypothetical protein
VGGGMRLLLQSNAANVAWKNRFRKKSCDCEMRLWREKTALLSLTTLVSILERLTCSSADKEPST